MLGNQDTITEPSLTITNAKHFHSHTGPVVRCEWHPTKDLLVTGSSDNTARVWNVSQDSANGQRQLVLRHFVPRLARAKEISNDITNINWNKDGSLLATAGFDGGTRLWNGDGSLACTLSGHKGPVFAAKFNHNGSHLASCGLDKIAIIWDVKTGKSIQKFRYHSFPIMDLEWITNEVFVTCGADKIMNLCKLNETRPMKIYKGHTNEINCIRFNPRCAILASGADDMTLKLWSLDRGKCIRDLKGHTREVYAIEWAPSGPGTENPQYCQYIASASFDSTASVWHVEKGIPVYTLTKHTEPVYSVAYSPDGKYLATASYDKYAHIWCMKSGELVCSYQSYAGLMKACFNSTGTKLGAIAVNGTVAVLDLKML